MLKLILFLYVVPAVLVVVQAFLIENVSKRKLPFNAVEYVLVIVIPLWNWYMAYQMFNVVRAMNISIRPTMDFNFYHSVQLLPSIMYVIGQGFIILFPFYGSLTITPKELSED